MRIIIGADHAGYSLKESLKTYLVGLGHIVVDVGAANLEDGDDYPIYVKPMVAEIIKEEGVMAIFCAGSGEGEAIALNRNKGVRAVVYNQDNLELIEKTRTDNNANVLCIGSRFVSEEAAKIAVTKWLETPFDKDSRHARRLLMIDNNITEA